VRSQGCGNKSEVEKAACYVLVSHAGREIKWFVAFRQLMWEAKPPVVRKQR
jgi:hypothetical protein